jgi:sulfonate dioxygenase
MQKYLEGLTAIHSADIQAIGSTALGRTVRREPVTTEHPLIRTNPVTGWKSLFFNPGFVTKIVGIPKTESDTIIGYLNEVISTTQEFHVRFMWGANDVALWDNRSTVSTSLPNLNEKSCQLTTRRTTLLPTASHLTADTQSASLCELSVHT